MLSFRVLFYVHAPAEADTDTELPSSHRSIVSYNTRDLLRACLSSLEARHSEGEVTLQSSLPITVRTMAASKWCSRNFLRSSVFYRRQHRLRARQQHGVRKKRTALLFRFDPIRSRPRRFEDIARFHGRRILQQAQQARNFCGRMAGRSFHTVRTTLEWHYV
jgi:hypothetical protein